MGGMGGYEGEGWERGMVGGGGLTYYMTEHYCVVRRGLYNVLYIHIRGDHPETDRNELLTDQRF